jgi:hypothetical protein
MSGYGPAFPKSPSSQGHSQPLMQHQFYGHARTTSMSSSVEGPGSPPPLPVREVVTHQGVQTGHIGGGFGPYAVSNLAFFSRAASQYSLLQLYVARPPHRQC